MDKHVCSCSELLTQMMNRSVFPRVDKLGNGYVIVDPSIVDVSDDIVIMIIAKDGMWKIEKEKHES